MQIDLGEVSLQAELHVSSTKNSPFFLVSHPHPVYGGTMENKVVDQFFRRATEKNHSVLRYNMRGIGDSTGQFDKGVGEEEDLAKLIEWVQAQKLDYSQMILFGYSFGSWLTAKIVSRMPMPCILIAPPVSLYPFPVLSSSHFKMIFSATNDEFVSNEAMESYVASLSDPKKHVPIQDADHYFIGTTTQLTRTIFQTLDQTIS